MPKITFVENGENKTLDVPNGLSILEIAHQNNIDLEGACEGSLACSTCHIIVNDQDFAKLGEASEEEEDMLDLAFGVTTTSRLGCQIIMSDDLDGLTITVPSQTRNIDAEKITNKG
ncbi:MAG: 2Fe-2S iron-sulfur cluster binding domain-containing protein [Rickettsiales bacterium]|jgi:ferredoxin|nr:2Fe-2S iron-sulfur cluster binding domain-containing protein [Rickettsiales bacterium]